MLQRGLSWDVCCNKDAAAEPVGVCCCDRNLPSRGASRASAQATSGHACLQGGWVLWGLSHLWPLVRDCAAAAAAAVQPRCRHLSPLGHAAALAALSWTAFVLLPLAYLLTLQMYLLLTNQTTIEVTKGPRLRYLTPYYAGAHEGKSAYCLLYTSPSPRD